jgi:hypothetical protein
MNAMPAIKARLTARMNRYQGVKERSISTVDTPSPTTAVGRHHPPCDHNAIPARTEQGGRGEGERLRERALVTDQP